jgi:GT2 family glycosyltransferase
MKRVPVGNGPDVSAVVCNLNGMRFLPRLLETLGEQQGVRVEIIVADRESTDGSREYLARFPEIKVVTEPAATGLAAGYHAAFAAASHDLLFFCNEDLWLDPECLSRLARHVAVADRIGAADPWQWSYDGSRLIRAGTRFVSARFDPISCYPPRAFDFLVPLAGGEAVAFGCGGAVLIHREMYLDAGGWDPGFFMDFDDVELFLRAWQRGWHCVTAPDAKVYHAVGMSAFQAGPPPSQVRFRRQVGGHSNRAILCLKHFTGPSLLWAAADLLVPLASSLLRLRLEPLKIHAAALWLTLRRLPAVLRFRRASQQLIRRRPGQLFFTAAELQRGERGRLRSEP